MVRVALFGSNGYIGRHLSGYLHDKGANIQLFDIQDAAIDGQGGYYKCDVLNSDWWGKFVPTDLWRTV